MDSITVTHLEQFLKSCIALLECNDLENFLETKLHPIDVLSLPALKLSVVQLCNKFWNETTNLSIHDLKYLFEQGLLHIQQFSCHQWSFFEEIAEEMKNRYQYTKYEAYFQLQNEDDKFSHLQNQVLCFRYSSQRNRWFLCNF